MCDAGQKTNWYWRNHITLGDERRAVATLTGAMGAAPPIEEKPKLLGPDGKPISCATSVPFGFTNG